MLKNLDGKLKSLTGKQELFGNLSINQKVTSTSYYQYSLERIMAKAKNSADHDNIQGNITEMSINSIAF